MAATPTSTTAAVPNGKCYRCDGITYDGLPHYCPTALKFNPSPSSSGATSSPAEGPASDA